MIGLYCLILVLSSQVFNDVNGDSLGVASLFDPLSLEKQIESEIDRDMKFQEQLMEQNQKAQQETIKQHLLGWSALKNPDNLYIIQVNNDVYINNGTALITIRNGQKKIVQRPSNI